MSPGGSEDPFAGMYPTKEESRRSVLPIFRGSILGFFVGLLPGPCTVISTFVSYALEKRISKTRRNWDGSGGRRGGARGGQQQRRHGSHDPSLTLGIPFAAPSAVMLAGLRCTI